MNANTTHTLVDTDGKETTFTVKNEGGFRMVHIAYPPEVDCITGHTINVTTVVDATYARKVWSELVADGARKAA